MKENYIASFLKIFSGGKYYQKDGERRGYEPEVFSRIFWEQTKAEEEEKRFVQRYTSVIRPIQLLTSRPPKLCISLSERRVSLCGLFSFHD